MLHSVGADFGDGPDAGRAWGIFRDLICSRCGQLYRLRHLSHDASDLRMGDLVLRKIDLSPIRIICGEHGVGEINVRVP